MKQQRALPAGCLIIDIAGTELTATEREILRHPLLGGVILFSRNFASREQLTALCAEIHALQSPPPIIAVDHEGGRVQRFREGFSAIPPMRVLGELWERDIAKATEAARALGFMLAAELRACDVDLSFTPVLDLDWGNSAVIGSRAFHRQPQAVSVLANALIRGLRRAGMTACGKHFPGHGWVSADSHVDLPVDSRQLTEMQDDLAPYRQVSLPAVMLAHVVYPAVDTQPAGFSRVWLDYLRREIKFSGAVFSDDLSMVGAHRAGGIIERTDAAWNAGCDLLLICNAPEDAVRVLDGWQPQAREDDVTRLRRLAQLAPEHPPPAWDELTQHPDWQAAKAFITALNVT